MTSPAQHDNHGTSHTPGPWSAERAVDENGFETGKVWIIMNCAPCGYDFDRWEDAVLAAAAPELLAALQRMMPDNLCSDNPNVPDNAIVPVDFYYGELRQARAAITKALGQ